MGSESIETDFLPSEERQDSPTSESVKQKLRELIANYLKKITENEDIEKNNDDLIFDAVLYNPPFAVRAKETRCLKSEAKIVAHYRKLLAYMEKFREAIESFKDARTVLFSKATETNTRYCIFSDSEQLKTLQFRLDQFQRKNKNWIKPRNYYANDVYNRQTKASYLLDLECLYYALNYAAYLKSKFPFFQEEITSLSLKIGAALVYHAGQLIDAEDLSCNDINKHHKDNLSNEWSLLRKDAVRCEQGLLAAIASLKLCAKDSSSDEFRKMCSVLSDEGYKSFERYLDVATVTDGLDKKYAQNFHEVNTGSSPSSQLGLRWQIARPITIGIALIGILLFYYSNGAPAAEATAELWNFSHDESAVNGTGIFLGLDGTVINMLLMAVSCWGIFGIDWSNNKTGAIFGLAALLVNLLIPAVTNAGNTKRIVAGVTGAFLSAPEYFYLTTHVQPIIEQKIRRITGRMLESEINLINATAHYNSVVAQLLEKAYKNRAHVCSKALFGVPNRIIDVMAFFMQHSPKELELRFGSSDGKWKERCIYWPSLFLTVLLAEGGMAGFLYSTFSGIQHMMSIFLEFIWSESNTTATIATVVASLGVPIAMSSNIVLSFIGAERVAAMFAEVLTYKGSAKTFARVLSPILFWFGMSSLLFLGIGSYGTTFLTFAKFLEALSVEDTAWYFGAFFVAIASAIMSNVILSTKVCQPAKVVTGSKIVAFIKYLSLYLFFFP